MAAVRSCGAFCFYLFFLLLVSSESQSVFRGDSFRRKLNPGWPAPPPPGGDLLHVRAVGLNDTLHFLFCSQGAPTLLLVHTNSSSSTVEVDWPQFLMRNLLEYDDVNDTANATSDLFPPYDLQDFTWAPLNLSGASALLCGAAATFANGSLWRCGSMACCRGHRVPLPIGAPGGGRAYPLSRVEVRRSIDDEFTPTIFKNLPWFWVPPVEAGLVPPVLPLGGGGFSDAVLPPRPQRGEEAFSALITAFYAEPETFGMNVSFAISGEPFYNRSRFLSWTVLLGVGTPPMDSFSPVVLIMMAVGLGTPMMLLVLGGVFVCVRKRASASNYEPIN
ncbi:hypothetical protein F7725_024622 [Dissostichus mawsoni]|uniref:Glycosylated lysosomal membrane protein n=1 Tax=Dissostichus mawsoni TaxID=36200 RepID=A0A7J5XAI3_DISMA|nr:hypothetical protein F7725_024622 [Dissostichus mawsoni]